MARPHLVAGFVEHLHPVGDEMAFAGLGIVELAGERCRATAAQAMAHHQDLTDVKLGDGELQRGRDAVDSRGWSRKGARGRDVAHDEHLAGTSVEDLCRVDPAVGAGQNHHLRALALGQLGPALALACPALVPEAAIAFDQLRQVRH